MRITALQEGYATTSRRQSRVAALSAYLLTWFIFTPGKQVDWSKMYSMLTPLNLRSLVNPPISEYHFGNIVSSLIATVAAGDGGAEVVQKFWEAKKAMYDGHTKARDVTKKLMSQGDGVERFIFSSLCGFSLYGADFGWGKPVWVVVFGFPSKNMAVFTDTKSGAGIEVVLHLSKQDMEKYEANLELNNQRL